MKIEAIHKHLADMSVSNYEINADQSVDVSGDVLVPYDYTYIPVKFRNIKGSFNCDSTQLNSLKNSPTWVSGNFDCSNTNISTLRHAPTNVGGDFNCSKTNIKSLRPCPSNVGGDFLCTDTKITSLRGIQPHINGSLWVRRSLLKSLCNAPLSIRHNFWIDETQITTGEVDRCRTIVGGKLYASNWLMEQSTAFPILGNIHQTTKVTNRDGERTNRAGE